jgi:hypothetical protein
VAAGFGVSFTGVEVKGSGGRGRGGEGVRLSYQLKGFPSPIYKEVVLWKEVFRA